MSFVVNLEILSLPASISYRIIPEMACELADRFEFEKVNSLSGEFQITAVEDYFLLTGTYSGEVVLNGKIIAIEEPITVHLLTSHTQEALFEITDDFELLDDHKSFDLEEVLGQYLYLEVCGFE